MVLRHASERFRLAYELPLETYELFGAFKQFADVTLESLDEDSYRFDALAKHDLWRKKSSTGAHDELIDYKDVSESIYDNDLDDDEVPQYDDEDGSPHSASASSLVYQWHRDRHFDIHNRITKYVDDKMYAVDLVRMPKPFVLNV